LAFSSQFGLESFGNFKFSYFCRKFWSTIFGPKYSHRGGQQKLGKFAK
jgi:hypothetical protein